MKCKNVQKSLTVFDGNELTKKTNDAIKAHVGSCPKCQKVFKSFSYVEDFLNAPLVLPADPYFKTRLKARIKAASNIPVPEKLRPLFSPGYIFVGLLLGAMLGFNAGKAVLQTPQTSINYADYYSNSDVFNTFPNGSLAGSYASHNQHNNIK